MLLASLLLFRLGNRPLRFAGILLFLAGTAIGLHQVVKSLTWAGKQPTPPITTLPWAIVSARRLRNTGRMAEPSSFFNMQPSPARSDDPGTWPSEWPDRPIEWAGQWNGFFGRGVQNADVESYFVFDDAPDEEWTQEPHRFFPCDGDEDRGGLGIEVATRGFQWNHPLAQDVIFWLYEITNECTTDYSQVYFTQYIDWGVGGTDDSGDDEGAYNQADAEGFIRLNALRLRLGAKRTHR